MGLRNRRISLVVQRKQRTKRRRRRSTETTNREMMNRGMMNQEMMRMSKKLRAIEVEDMDCLLCYYCVFSL
jgi:hypothetical protein